MCQGSFVFRDGPLKNVGGRSLSFGLIRVTNEGKAEVYDFNDNFRRSDIGVLETLSIQTINSVYYFLVIDPVKAYGMMSGGVIGPDPTETFVCPPASLRPGGKARLLIETENGTRFITTSTITRIQRLKSD